MNVAIIEIPYGHKLAFPLEALHALESACLVANEAHYGLDGLKVVDSKATPIEIKVVRTDTVEGLWPRKPFSPWLRVDSPMPSTASPSEPTPAVSPAAPALAPFEDDGTPF